MIKEYLSPTLIITLILLFLLMWVSVRKGKLTLPAASIGSALGLAILIGTGYAGISMLVAFFVLGVFATAHKRSKKVGAARHSDHPQQRTAGQVFANGGIAGIVSLIAIFDTSNWWLYTLMVAGSLASATADTLSSELGMAYGKRFFNIVTWKPEAKGLDGVISIEGTLIGAAGAGIIAVIPACWYGYDPAIPFILLAGVTGNFVDSLLGAAYERKQFMSNDTVNLLNTLTGALFRLLYYLFIMP